MPEKQKIEQRRDDGVELENQFILRLPEVCMSSECVS